jgi:hypothetical protein
MSAKFSSLRRNVFAGAALATAVLASAGISRPATAQYYYPYYPYYHAPYYYLYYGYWPARVAVGWGWRPWWGWHAGWRWGWRGWGWYR